MALTKYYIQLSTSTISTAIIVLADPCWIICLLCLPNFHLAYLRFGKRNQNLKKKRTEKLKANTLTLISPYFMQTSQTKQLSLSQNIHKSSFLHATSGPSIFNDLIPLISPFIHSPSYFQTHSLYIRAPLQAKFH